MLAAALIGLRALLRRRINPNRNYPQPPMLPAGTPPALLRDEYSGGLRLASNPAQRNSAGTCVDLQAGRHNLPQICCECLKPTELGQQYAIRASRLITIGIPWCAACQGKSGRLFQKIFLIAVGITIFALAAIYFLSGVDATLFWTLGGFAVLAAVAIPSIVAVKLSRRKNHGSGPGSRRRHRALSQSGNRTSPRRANHLNNWRRASKLKRNAEDGIRPFPRRCSDSNRNRVLQDPVAEIALPALHGRSGLPPGWPAHARRADRAADRCDSLLVAAGPCGPPTSR